jgi:hypothetical protein
VGKPDQRRDLLGRLIRLKGQLDFNTLTTSLTVAPQHRPLFSEMGSYFDPLISEVQFLFGRYLRHVGEQSEGYAGHKVAEGGGGCALAAGHILTLIADKGKPAGIRLPGDGLLTPIFNGTGLGKNFNMADGA